MSDTAVTARGMPWVVAQFALIAATVVLWFGGPKTKGLAAIGLVLFVVGTFIATWAVVSLATRRSFTLFPRPREVGTLVTGGPFRVVRHPIYTGALVINFGTSLVMSWMGIFPTVALTILWWCKSGREEKILATKFPEYAEYARRVRARMIPGLL